MPLFSPVSVLFDSDGTELSVSQSQAIEASQPGIFAVGSGSNGATFFKVADDGTLFVSGAFEANITFPVSQSTFELAAPNTTLSSAIASTTAFEILPTNPDRKMVLLHVDGNRTWYIGFGATPTTVLYSVKFGNGSTYEVPERYTGPISVISNANGGSTLLITEITY
jgi:hypothetical protein